MKVGRGEERKKEKRQQQESIVEMEEELMHRLNWEGSMVCAIFGKKKHTPFRYYDKTSEGF